MPSIDPSFTALGSSATADVALERARNSAWRTKTCVSNASAANRSTSATLADVPSYGEASWSADFDINPFDVPDAEKIDRLAARGSNGDAQGWGSRSDAGARRLGRTVLQVLNGFSLAMLSR